MNIHTGHPQPLEMFDANEVAQVSLKVFFWLTNEWDLNRGQALVLLGSPSEKTLNSWRDGSSSPLPTTHSNESVCRQEYTRLRIACCR